MGSETIVGTNPKQNGAEAIPCPCCGNPIEESWVFQEFARLMGRRAKGKTSEKKAEASRINGRKGGRRKRQ